MKLCLVELLKFDLMYFFVVLYHVSDCQCLFLLHFRFAEINRNFMFGLR